MALSPIDPATSPIVAWRPRLGVTGHRPEGLAAVDLDALRGRVRQVLARLRPRGAVASAGTVVASLAEGADRLVVTEALGAGFVFVGILPFARDEFERDFATDASREEYRALLARAESVEELPGGRAAMRREQDAYAAAGEAMLDRSDLLLAIWDGELARGVGGTEQVVRSALGRGLPVVWIPTRPPYQVRLSTEANRGSLLTAQTWQTDDGDGDLLVTLNVNVNVNPNLTAVARSGGAA